MAKKLAKCPICRSSLDRKAETFPFCSTRCRSVDLGSWLGDEYRIPDDPTGHPTPDERRTQ